MIAFQKTKTVLSVSRKILPETNPTAIRSGKTLRNLPERWQVHVLSGNESINLERAKTHFVKTWYPARLFRCIKSIKFTKLLDWFVWPDDDIFWLPPTVIKGRRLIQDNNIDVILVFLKPYSAGLIGILLKWLTGKPLVINVCEPSTCDDLYSDFPTKIHYYMDRWLEDFYVRQSDAILYVSQLSLELVRARQPEKYHSRFSLVRGGADPVDFLASNSANTPSDQFNIVYTGGMTGWGEFIDPPKMSLVTRIRLSWKELGRYRNIKVDSASSSPVFIGQAINQVTEQYPEWKHKIQLNIYGNKFDKAQAVLEKENLLDVVNVIGPLPHREAVEKLQQSDLLFMALPDRIDDTPGDRISLKTYEYLMTEKPILAAVPRGENRSYLSDKPGVHIVTPSNVEAMAQVIDELFSRKLAGESLRVDRTATHTQISYVRRGEELANLILEVLENTENSKSS